MTEVVLESLNGNHDRDSFDCGNQILNEFLQNFANQKAVKHESRTNVVVAPGEHTIRAYATVIVKSIDNRNKAFPKISKSFVPMLEIGRLGTDVKYAGKGYARILIRDALERAVVVDDATGCVGVIVQSKPEAREMYPRFGFLLINEAELKYFMPIATVRAALERIQQIDKNA